MNKKYKDYSFNKEFFKKEIKLNIKNRNNKRNSFIHNTFIKNNELLNYSDINQNLNNSRKIIKCYSAYFKKIKNLNFNLNNSQNNINDNENNSLLNSIMKSFNIYSRNKINRINFSINK